MKKTSSPISRRHARVTPTPIPIRAPLDKPAVPGPVKETTAVELGVFWLTSELAHRIWIAVARKW